jgi:hypothetical protein
MTKSYDQTFMLTTNRKRHNVCNCLRIHNDTEVHLFQSAFLQVRSDECGLFA